MLCWGLTELGALWLASNRGSPAPEQSTYGAGSGNIYRTNGEDSEGGCGLVEGGASSSLAGISFFLH